ncbi:MAG: TIM barrel protein [Bacteroidales bacterium]
MKTTRREFIEKTLLISSGLALGATSAAGSAISSSDEFKSSSGNKTNGKGFRFSVFSKCLQWLNYEEMADFVAGLGFDGIELTVRPNGHVLPENVETDLPKAFSAAKKAGISIFMIVTSINDANDQLTEKILKTASSLGIEHYRMDWLYYDDKKPVDENLKLILQKLQKLETLNRKFKIHGEYQNHSGKYSPNSYFGSAIWDLYQVLSKIDSPWMGSQYDIMHATVEGAYAWETGLKRIYPYIHSLAFKDFIWQKNQDKWATECVNIGEGMVNMDYYLDLIKNLKIECPVSVHYEYPMGGIEKGEKILKGMDKKEVMQKMKNDLETLKRNFKEKGLIP